MPANLNTPAPESGLEIAQGTPKKKYRLSESGLGAKVKKTVAGKLPPVSLDEEEDMGMDVPASKEKSSRSDATMTKKILGYMKKAPPGEEPDSIPERGLKTSTLKKVEQEW